jgi:hypothetical protein
MESRKVPALFALVGVIAAVVLFLVLKDDTADEDTTLPPPQQSATGEGERNTQKPEKQKPAKPEVPVVEIKGGQPVGGVQELEFKVGDEVEIEIRSDAADEVHLHAYDVTLPIPAGTPRTLTFEATIDGGYELESHVTGALLANISIVPD